MSTPHKATEQQWKIVSRRAEVDWNNDSTDSVLLEVADRVAALEAVLASHGEQISGLHSQHNLVVDSITDLQGCVNQLEAAATQPPATAADHSRGAPEMVATDEELIETFSVGTRGPFPSGFRAVYNLGREHSAQPRQEVDPSQLSDGYHTFAELYEHRHALFLAFMRAMPQHCWFSLRHADGEKCFGGDDWFIAGAELPGGSSVTYHLPADLYPLAKATGAGRLDLGRPWDGHTASDVVSRLMEWAAPVDPLKEEEAAPSPASAERLLYALTSISVYGKDTLSGPENGSGSFSWYRSGIREMVQRADAAIIDFTGAANPTPPPAPTGGLVEEVARLLANRISTMRPGADCTPLACTVLCVIADAAEKMAHDPNLTWERVAIWLDVESKLEGRADV